VIVYTCVFGYTDALQEPLETWGSRFVCFTDQPITSKRWEIVKVPPLERPKRECRKYKLNPDLVFPGEEVTLWIDAPMMMRIDPEHLARKYPGVMTAFVHSKRKRIKDECEAIIRAGKAIPEQVRDQLRVYQEDGFDTDLNPQTKLHNGCVLLRRHTPEMNQFSRMWDREVQTRTLRDQMSMDYCAWKLGFVLNDFRGQVNKNSYFIRAAVQSKPTNDF
jgi:hypothetical protein